MKQFDLEEYKKNPPRKVVTRDGRPVRIVFTDAKGDYPVVALAIDEDGSEYTIRSTRYGISGFTEDDLYLSDEPSYKTTKEGWIGIYRSKISSNLYLTSSYIYDSEKKIEKYAERHPDGFVGMAKVTWEEEV